MVGTRRQQSAEQPAHGWLRGWRGPVLALAMFAGFVFSFAAAIEALIDAGQFGGGYGAHLGGEYVTDSSLPAGYARLLSVDPGGVAEKAGMRAGDAVRFAEPWKLHTYKQDGDLFVVWVTRPEGERQIRLIARVEHMKTGVREAFLLLTFGKLVVTIFCAFMLVRGWGRPAPMLLSMLAYGYAALNLPHWAQDGSIAPFATVINQLLSCGFVGLPLFAMALYAEEVGPVGRGWRWLVYGIAAIYAASAVLRGYCVYWLLSLPVVGVGDGIRFALFTVFLGLTMYWLFCGWRRGVGAASNRFAVIQLAMLALLAFYLAFFVALAAFRLSVLQWFASPWGLGLIAVANIGAPGLLVYAVLRQKVVDTGFAINRTLIFAVVSFVLLATFGVLEWSAKKLLPDELKKQSAWIDAGLALMIFLVFHRLRDLVEEVIERLLFRRWHENESRLRRFVASAAHFDRIAALNSAFVAELRRFSHGAEVALYLREGHVGFVRNDGGLAGSAERYSPDLADFALMRAERSPLDLTDLDSALPGALALPMLDHGALTGFVLLGRSPDNHDYRPDEIEHLGKAAHQVGLDLRALQTGELQDQVAEAEARIAEQERTIATLNQQLSARFA